MSLLRQAMYSYV